MSERVWEPDDSPVLPPVPVEAYPEDAEDLSVDPSGAPAMCPECAAKKHANCDGTALNNDDVFVPCACAERGHTAEEPDESSAGESVDAPTAAKLAGLSYRQVDYWVRAGYVECEQGPLPGSGRRRYFTPAEVRVLVLMAAMTRAGWLPAEAAVAARTLVAGFPVVLLSRPGLTLSVRLDVSPV